MSTAPSIPATQRAWQFSTAAGGLDKHLRLNPSAPLPRHDAATLGADKVLVKVLAASINPVDHKMPEVPLVGRLLYSRDAVPGSDFAGVVVKTGNGVASGHGAAEEIKVGHKVFGRVAQPNSQGTLQEYLVLPRKDLAILPEDQGVTAVDAAGIGTAGLTAWQSIAPYVKAGQGDAVFINGGSGGCGIWSIQIAKALGCHVVTTCSGSNVDFCKSLGADEVIDYRTTDVQALLLARSRDASGLGPAGLGFSKKFDLIVDNVGNSDALFWQARHYLVEKGRYVQVGVEAGMPLLGIIGKWLWPGWLSLGKRPFEMMSVQNSPKDCGDIARLIAQGKIKTILYKGEALEFEDAITAFRTIQSHRTTGKIVIRVAEE